MKKIIIFLFLAFSLGACTSTKIEMAQGYTQGQYRVTNIDIQPANELVASEVEYDNTRQYLTKRLGEVLLNKGSKQPDVSMTIVITNVSLEINAARSMMIGDSYRLSTIVTLKDATNGAKIAEFPVSTFYGNSQGLGGFIGASLFSDKKQAKKMLEQYMHDLFARLYPRSNK